MFIQIATAISDTQQVEIHSAALTKGDHHLGVFIRDAYFCGSHWMKRNQWQFHNVFVAMPERWQPGRRDELEISLGCISLLNPLIFFRLWTLGTQSSPRTPHPTISHWRQNARGRSENGSFLGQLLCTRQNASHFYNHKTPQRYQDAWDTLPSLQWKPILGVYVVVQLLSHVRLLWPRGL